MEWLLSCFPTSLFDGETEMVNEFGSRMPTAAENFFSHAGSSLRHEFDFNFLFGANENVRGKRRGVNSVFLVQLRKILDRGFSEWIWIRKFWRMRLQGA
jgi:hypothetical protein